MNRSFSLFARSLKSAATALAILMGLSLGGARSAQAEDDPPKRPTPDYDGRGKAPTTAGDVALWVPRLVMSPLYLTSEYVLRRPMGAFIVAAEKSNLPEVLTDFFTFDKDHKIGLVPTAYVDFGVLPSVGFLFFWDDFIAKKNDLRFQFGFWGGNWLKFGIADTYAFNARSNVSFRASWWRRRDALFFGIGPRSSHFDQSRYQAETADVSVVFNQSPTRGIHLESTVGARDKLFGDGACCSDPTVQDSVAQGRFALPPGFTHGYTIAYNRLELTLDSRAPRPKPQSGVRVSLEAQPEYQVRPSKGAWLRYGGTVAGFVDVTGKNRVLSLAVTTLFVDPIDGTQIPFTEQISLGGQRYMRGYAIGRLVDRSAAVATLQYEWPIWVWLDGTIHVAVGNVFDAGLKDFDTKLLRLSSGIGVRSNSSPDSQFEILFGIGTDTFEDHASISSMRLVIGGTYGY